ncbi:MAG: hypothetical protein V4706_12090, partial [Pseudomonadota bacterium]
MTTVFFASEGAPVERVRGASARLPRDFHWAFSNFQRQISNKKRPKKCIFPMKQWFSPVASPLPV